MGDISYVSIYITASNLAEAERIAEAVVKRRLAACANVVEKVKSIYWWKGTLERADESLLFLKTKREKVKEIICLVRQMHSYENPAILVLPILEGSEEYFKWMDEEIS
ncbi:MAG: divalent-cation tolerance protein CutA [Candidatus Hydrothermarchaeales archaeon]